MLVDKPIIDLLRGTPTPYIADALVRLDIKGCKGDGILPIVRFDDPFKHVAGPAVTARFLPSRYKGGYQTSPFRHTEIIENAPSGSVIVFEGASISQRASETALRSGLEAAICDTAIRDIDEVQALKFPVFCPYGPIGAKMESYAATMECVQFNVPVHIGLHGDAYRYWLGAQVQPEDIIVGDNNGVIVIPKKLLGNVVDVIKEIHQLEGSMHKMIQNGESWKEIYKGVHAQKYGVKGR